MSEGEGVEVQHDDGLPQRVAFYLPQFHPIPENDAWWGRVLPNGPTRQARPLFAGHYQPHVPADLGFYDLRLAETREAQARLARRYGIDGLLLLPLLVPWPANPGAAVRRCCSGTPEFPFCLCWANESWSRRWDDDEEPS